MFLGMDAVISDRFNTTSLCTGLSGQTFLVRGRKIANTPNSGKNEHR